jgi:stage III sporulation protein AC
VIIGSAFRVRVTRNDYRVTRLSKTDREKSMDINLIFKIAGIGILVSVLNMVLKQAGKEEQAQMLTLAGVIIVLLMVIQLVQKLFTDVRSVFGL